MGYEESPLIVSNGHELIAIVKDLKEGDKTTVFLWNNEEKDKDERKSALGNLLAHARACAGLDPRTNIAQALWWGSSRGAVYRILHSESNLASDSLPGNYGIYCISSDVQYEGFTTEQVLSAQRVVFIPKYVRRCSNRES